MKKIKQSIKSWIYRQAIKVIAKRIVKDSNLLTPQYLLEHGWAEKDGYYTEQNMKDRDLITIQFESHYYRVWHSSKLTFIALESSVEWFELYYLLAHGDNGRYELAGI